MIGVQKPFLQRAKHFVSGIELNRSNHKTFYRNLTYPKGDQIWTGFLLEGPHYGEGYEAVDGIFDWVATYRRDSDIFVPYGQFYQTNVDQSVTDLDSMRVTPK